MRFTIPVKIILLLLFVFLGIAKSASAATYYWVGGTTDSNTSNPVNWNTTAGACADSSNTSLPTASDDIHFGGTGYCQNSATIDTDLSVNNLYLDTAYSGTVTQNAAITVATNFTQAAGTFISDPTKTFSVGGSFAIPAAGASGSFSRFSGSGTSDSHYLIYDVYGLQGMQGFLTGKYFDLANNIDATATSLWNSNGSGGYYGFRPVSTDTYQFTGTFNGQNYTISNLYINRPSVNYVGLFGYSTGSISNVGLVGGSVTGGYRAGGLVGLSDGTVSNSYTSFSMNSDNSIVGGLVGYNYTNGVISNSYTTGDVLVTPSGSNFMSGGLVGINIGTISNSHSTGNVTAYEHVGGLVGSNGTISGVGSISNSYATGNVTHNGGQYGSGNFGGLVGYNQAPSTISNSYARGNIVQGNSITGNVGGLVGRNAGVVQYSYSTGSLSGNSNLGGFIGLNSSGTYTANYWDTTTSATTTGVGGGNIANVTGAITSLMKTEGTFSGWDFTNPWVMLANSYPTLAPYTITATAGENGTLSPSGSVRLASHGSQEFTITPLEGYNISRVLVNDNSIGGVSNYTFTNVLGNHTISATFKQRSISGSKAKSKITVTPSQDVSTSNQNDLPNTNASIISISSSTPITGSYSFGMKSPTVLIVQKILNSDPSTKVAEYSAGSPGKETNFFGSATRIAVQKFQLKHGIVLSPQDPGYGFVGPKTRSKLNQFLEKGQ